MVLFDHLKNAIEQIFHVVMYLKFSLFVKSGSQLGVKSFSK